MKETSQRIAGLIGPLFIAVAVSILMNRENMSEMAAELTNGWSLIVLSGALLFVAGIAIVRVHNVWQGGWPVIVTVLGWLAIVSGLARMIYPRQLAGMAVSFASNMTALVLSAVALLFLGVYLTLRGYDLLH